ncbi:hypothetical protein [Methylotenera sp.]|uniref:hypothetical protein n=1 Tax=Methylotenera sp. TaxID=2051956 RepID=UPI00248810B3|nr:hypothetical protein [Methylotenera sp.]MDI1360607.1 hypothetical protein [Methylotenera sp.]
MNIYIDESGTFVNAVSLGSWNVVSAYVAPEGIRTKLERVLNILKQHCREESFKEVKLYQIPEEALLEFLRGLSQLNGLLFCTATDAGLNTNQEVTFHKAGQVQSIRKNIPNMLYPEGKAMVSSLANDVEAMPIQLYVQLTCQVQLIYEVISRSINYYAQRTPGTLSSFRWFIDQKDSEKTIFEFAFERLAPALLQSRTIREPMPFVNGFDYRQMSKYEFNDATRPTYLKDEYGLPEMDGFNIGLVELH